MVSTPKDNITTIHALLGLPDNATLEQVFAAFDEAKKNPNKNPWHTKEVFYSTSIPMVVPTFTRPPQQSEHCKQQSTTADPLHCKRSEELPWGKQKGVC